MEHFPISTVVGLNFLLQQGTEPLQDEPVVWKSKGISEFFSDRLKRASNKLPCSLQWPAKKGLQWHSKKDLWSSKSRKSMHRSDWSTRFLLTQPKHNRLLLHILAVSDQFTRVVGGCRFMQQLSMNGHDSSCGR
jgi:hypothetical protein